MAEERLRPQVSEILLRFIRDIDVAEFISGHMYWNQDMENPDSLILATKCYHLLAMQLTMRLSLNQRFIASVFSKIEGE